MPGKALPLSPVHVPVPPIQLAREKAPVPHLGDLRVPAAFVFSLTSQFNNRLCFKFFQIPDKMSLSAFTQETPQMRNLVHPTLRLVANKAVNHRPGEGQGSRSSSEIMNYGMDVLGRFQLHGCWPVIDNS